MLLTLIVAIGAGNLIFFKSSLLDVKSGLSTIHSNILEGRSVKEIEGNYLADINVTRKTYLLTVFSDEQISNQMESFVDSCRIALDWESFMVEPFVCGSRLYGVKGYKDKHCEENEQMLKYSSIYGNDLDNGISCNGCLLKSWKNFLQESHRDIYMIFRASRGMDFDECNAWQAHTLKDLSYHLNKEAKLLSVPPFNVKGAVCWSADTGTSTSELMKSMKGEAGNQSKFSVFFYRYMARNDHQGWRPYLSSKHVSDWWHCMRNRAISSPQILDLADKFRKSLHLVKDHYIAIHVSHALNR